MLAIVSGIHVYSVTIIVAAFMAGLGFGSLAGGAWADRTSQKRAVLGFAACELAIGVFAFASPWIYYDLAYLRLGFLAGYPLALPAVHLALLLPPTLLMGASLPLLSRGLVADLEGAAGRVGLLYGANTLGAAAGAFVTAWLLIGALGLAGTVRACALLNLAASAGALLLARRTADERAQERRAASATPPNGEASDLARWMQLYALSGFVALSFEILWFRLLDVTVKASPYTFGHLLGTLLFFLGTGSIAGSLLVGRVTRPEAVFFLGQWGITLTAGVAVVALCRLPPDWPLLRHFVKYWRLDQGVDVPRAIAALQGKIQAPEALSQFLHAYVLLPVLLLAAPAFLMGLTYPFVQRAVQTRLPEVGWRVGAIQAANIAGCMLGSLLTGTLLLDRLGTPRSSAALLAAGGVFAALLPGVSAPVRAGAMALSLLLAVAVPPPAVFWSRLHGAKPQELIVAEDATAVVSMPAAPADGANMRINGLGHGRVPYGGVHTLLGVVPGLVRSDLESALIVGLGSGNTAWAAAASRSLVRIDVFEIARPELLVLRRFAASAPSGPYRCMLPLLEDPRVRIEFTDGRLALRLAQRSYDLVEADALEPTMAMSGLLYSREFFELARQRLRPGGLLSTYVPTQRTRSSVLAVFPHALDFAAHGFLLASDRPLSLDPALARRRLHEPWLQAYFERAGLRDEATRQLEAFLAGEAPRRIGPEEPRAAEDGLNGDLFPRDEFDRTLRRRGEGERLSGLSSRLRAAGSR